MNAENKENPHLGFLHVWEPWWIALRRALCTQPAGEAERRQWALAEALW